LLTRRPRGTNDVLPDETPRWRFLEDSVRETCRRFGFGEIRTPLFEHAELFVKSTGETSDILEKETYTFEDRGRRLLTLRPEGTPGTVRAYLENGLHNKALPAKFYYLGPMFRYERPQAARYRQHTQFGVEIFGAPGPEADFETIMIGATFLRGLGLRDLEVQLNSIGCPVCRPGYRKALIEHFELHRPELCPDCQRRLQRNPLRLLDCKVEGCRPFRESAPKSLDQLCPECARHFDDLGRLLDQFGIARTVDASLVRGLDYYTRTVFELIYRGLGAQAAVCGGGRYDGLIEAAGGPPTPAVGFGMGLERVLLTLEGEGRELPAAQGPDVFLALAPAPVPERDMARLRLLDMLYKLRWGGLSAEADLLDRSIQQQLRQAGRLASRFVVVIGPEELVSGQVRVKEMATGGETAVSLAGLADWLTGRRIC
jgi:histidyl-tRNA synthetase